MNRQSAQDGILKVERYLDRVIELLEGMGPEIREMPGDSGGSGRMHALNQARVFVHPSRWSVRTCSPHIRRVQDKNLPGPGTA